MRNFYGKAYVDGRKTDVTFGPAAKDGGFSLDIYMRSKGESVKVLTVEGVANADTLSLHVQDSGGNIDGTEPFFYHIIRTVR